MPERITIRLDDAVYGRLADAAKAGGLDLSAFVRQALTRYLDHQGSGPTVLDGKASHRAECLSRTPDDCAMTVVRRCLPEVQAAIYHMTEQLEFPLAEILAKLLVLVASHNVAPPVTLPPSASPARHDTTPVIVPPLMNTTPPRVPSPPPRVQTVCQKCGALLALGGTLCGPCTGAYLIRPLSPVCEGCRQQIRDGGMGQRFCCWGCLAGHPHSDSCDLG